MKPIPGLAYRYRARDLRKLALLAVPFGIRIAYEALSWGRHVNLLTQAWEIVRDADRSNLGLCIDSYHVLALGTDARALDAIDPRRVFLAQLSDFLWQETRSPEDRMETARHYQLRGLQRRLQATAAADGRRARPALGEMDHRARLPPQPASAPDRPYCSALTTSLAST